MGQGEGGGHARAHAAWHGSHTHKCSVTPARAEGTVGVRAQLGGALSSGDESSCEELPGGFLPTPLLQAPRQRTPVPFLVLPIPAW